MMLDSRLRTAVEETRSRIRGLTPPPIRRPRRWLAVVAGFAVVAAFVVIVGVWNRMEPVNRPVADAVYEELIDRILSVDLIQVETDLRVECMQANGFEFDHDSSLVGLPVVFDPVAEFGSAEQAVEVVGTGLIYGTIEALTDPSDVRPAFPSAQYEATLLESASMEGETVVGGCAAWAQQTTQDDPTVRIMFEMETLRSAFPGFNIGNDPQVVEAWADWSDCMARTGYPNLADRGAMFELINEWKTEALSTADTPTAQAEALQKLLPDDKAIARADLACSDTADIDAITQRIRDEREAEFIATHQIEIEELARRMGLEIPGQ